MNQRDRYDRFVLPEGASKVSFQKDTKIPNAATFTILQEDHTLGNMIRMQLHDDSQVIFAGYRLPHPLEAKMVIKVQTNGEHTPEEVVLGAVKDLTAEVTDILRQFREECERFGAKNIGGMGMS